MIAGDVDLNGDGVISYDEFKAMMQVRHNNITCLDYITIFTFVY